VQCAYIPPTSYNDIIKTVIIIKIFMIVALESRPIGEALIAPYKMHTAIL